MSELKAISGHEIREDIDYNTRGVDPEDKEWRKYGKELCDTLYYRKSEVDKVIEKKDTKIIQLEALIENYNRISIEIIDNVNHHKYKRCLDKAALCRLEQERIELIECQDITDDDFNKLAKGFYKKWHKRWLKIAEQFKEAK